MKPFSFDKSKYYDIPESEAFVASLEKADELQARIDRFRPLKGDLWETIQFKLKTDWTYDSNAIEGSTLTPSETRFFLSEGLTVKGKPFKDFLDARNHAEAIDLLHDAVVNDRPITTGFMKDLNALILSGVHYTPAQDANGNLVKKAAHPGQYKTEANHVLTPSGDIHSYVPPEHVASEMDFLFDWITGQDSHPLAVASLAHYNMVRIHPFDDGNGRGARLLMNLILMKKGYVPAIIKMRDRAEYIDCLSQADTDGLEPFCLFVADSLIATQQSVVEVIEGTC